MSWRDVPDRSRTATPRSRPHESRLGRLLVATAAALLIFGAVPAYAAYPNVAGAGEGVDVGSLDELDCGPDPAELEDIAFIAEQDGISLDEAIARYGWQACFGEVTSYFSGAYPDQYAGAAIVEDGRGAWIAFKGEIPEEVTGFVEAIPVTVDLLGGRGFSEVELNETLQSVYANISNDEEVAAADGSYDIETGLITIHVQPLQTLTDPDQREQLRGRLLPDQPANPAIAIEVIVVDELGGAGDESSDGTQGISPTAVGLLAAGVLALLAGLLISRRRPS